MLDISQDFLNPCIRKEIITHQSTIIRIETIRDGRILAQERHGNLSQIIHRTGFLDCRVTISNFKREDLMTYSAMKMIGTICMSMNVRLSIQDINTGMIIMILETEMTTICHYRIGILSWETIKGGSAPRKL